MEKTCFKCGDVLPISEFYRHPKMSDGHSNKCKTCTKSDVRMNRHRNIEHYREFDRMRANLEHRVNARKAYTQTPRGRAAARRASQKNAQLKPWTKAATTILNNAVRDGRIVKLPCEVCGSRIRVHGHHDDYTKPLDVKWLCPKHHSEHHKAIREQARQSAN